MVIVVTPPEPEMPAEGDDATADDAEPLESTTYPLTLTRDLDITFALLVAGIPLSSAQYGLGMTRAAAGVTMTVSGAPSGLTATPGDAPGTLALRWTPGTDAMMHWTAGIRQNDLDAGNTRNLGRVVKLLRRSCGSRNLGVSVVVQR